MRMGHRGGGGGGGDAWIDAQREQLRVLKNQPETEPENRQLADHLAIHSYKLLKVLGEFNETRSSPDKALREVLLKSDEKYSHLIGRIEVLTDRKLERIYFPIEKFCLDKNTKKLQDRLQQRLIDPRKGCNWNSPSEKISAFTSWCEEILIEMEHKKEIGTSRFKHAFTRYRWHIRFCSMLLVLLLNLMVLVSADGSGDFQWFFIYPMQMLGVVQLVFAGLFLLIYMQGEGTVNYYKYWRSALPPNADPKGILATKHNRHLTIAVWHQRAARILWTLWFFRADLKLMWFSVYFIASVLAVLVSPYFYAVHLFDIFIWSPHLLTIANALYLQRVKLGLTVALLIVVMYAYSVFAFFVLSRYYEEDAGLWCDTPYRCFISNVGTGISMGGSTWEFLDPVDWDDDGWFITIVFVLFTLSYFFAVGVILLNIIFAIIVDTFGQLRDRQQDIQMEQYIRCFICSIESDTFQKQNSKKASKALSRQYGANRFQRHIEEDHNPWHYLWFFWHLKIKTWDLTTPQQVARTLTPKEYYVYKQITRGDFLSFIPIDRAIVLEKTKGKGGLPAINSNIATILQKVNRVGTQVSKIGNRLQRLEDESTSAQLRDAREMALSPVNTPRMGNTLQVPGGGRIRGRPLISGDRLLSSTRGGGGAGGPLGSSAKSPSPPPPLSLGPNKTRGGGRSTTAAATSSTTTETPLGSAVSRVFGVDTSESSSTSDGEDDDGDGGGILSRLRAQASPTSSDSRSSRRGGAGSSGTGDGSILHQLRQGSSRATDEGSSILQALMEDNDESSGSSVFQQLKSAHSSEGSSQQKRPKVRFNVEDEG